MTSLKTSSTAGAKAAMPPVDVHVMQRFYPCYCVGKCGLRAIAHGCWLSKFCSPEALAGLREAKAGRLAGSPFPTKQTLPVFQWRL
eukprot:m.113560 g.113560  ORF g.113560 m.113560 type:complete len:86 (+) comp13026_c0_seq3:1047-1304(+)